MLDLNAKLEDRVRERTDQLELSRRQLRKLATRRESDLEQERKRIARELHDELGQLLTALQLNISMLEMEVAGDAADISARIESIKEVVGGAMKAARQVSSQLRPAAFDLGLIPALEWMTRNFAINAGLACDLQIEACSGDEMDDDGAIVLYRIAQESLTNVARHACAGTVVVVLRRRGESLQLSVEDDGIGFDPACVGESSFGLVGIRERTMMLGGDVDIDSAPNQGTVVAVRIPLHAGGSHGAPDDR